MKRLWYIAMLLIGFWWCFPPYCFTVKELSILIGVMIIIDSVKNIIKD